MCACIQVRKFQCIVCIVCMHACMGIMYVLCSTYTLYTNMHAYRQHMLKCKLEYM